jgi:hypothetical protein
MVTMAVRFLRTNTHMHTYTGRSGMSKCRKLPTIRALLKNISVDENQAMSQSYVLLLTYLGWYILLSKSTKFNHGCLNSIKTLYICNNADTCIRTHPSNIVPAGCLFSLSNKSVRLHTCIHACIHNNESVQAKRV